MLLFKVCLKETKGLHRGPKALNANKFKIDQLGHGKKHRKIFKRKIKNWTQKYIESHIFVLF
jgi:hypothetical protein